VAHSHPRARALLSEAWLGYVRGDVTEVESAVADAISIARNLGDRQIEGRALSILGTTLSSYADEFERTESTLQEALEISRPFDDTWAIGFSLYSLGTLDSRRGRIREAIAYFQGCQDVSDTKGNTFGVGCAVFRLGILTGAVGDRAQAVALLRQAVQLHWALRNRRVLALCLQQLACAGGGILEAADQARLFAAAQALFDQVPDYLLPEYLLAAQRQGIEATREALGELRFAEAWLEGGRMALANVVQLALGVAERRALDPVTGRRLSPREQQICRLIMRGLTNREIGVRLGLSHHTVDNHLRRIFDKVGVSSRTALAMWSVQHSAVETAE
jgi:DNA-binding CsgD family transcriptional regulator/tetratricopeptide (TPR) repeat protein